MITKTFLPRSFLVIGGEDDFHSHEMVFAYQPNYNQWDTRDPWMQEPRHDFFVIDVERERLC